MKSIFTLLIISMLIFAGACNNEIGDDKKIENDSPKIEVEAIHETTRVFPAHTYTSPRDKFSVDFPAQKVELSEQAVPVEGMDDIKIRLFVCEYADAAFFIGVSSYSDEFMAKTDVDHLLTSGADNMLAAYENVVILDKRLSKDAEGNHGIEMAATAESEGFKIYVKTRNVFIGNYLYQIYSLAESTKQDDELIDHFMNSFKYLK